MAELYQGKFSGEEIDSRLDNVKRTCRFVIGTSTAGWTEADCDYLCDGTADDIEINAAIQDLPENGGEIVILDGNYYASSDIIINKKNIGLIGNKGNTTIYRNYDTTVQEDTSGLISIFIDGGDLEESNIVIDNISINKNNKQGRGVNIYSTNGVKIYNSTFTEATLRCQYSDNIIISSNYFHTCQIYANFCNGIIVSNNLFTPLEDNADGGSIQFISNYDSIISSNYFMECNYPIYASQGSSALSIVGNLMNECYHGIDIGGSRNTSVTGSFISYQITGINLSSTSNSTISGNTLYIPNTSKLENSIIAGSSSKNNLIIGNSIIGKNYVDQGTNNTWVNNKYQ